MENLNSTNSNEERLVQLKAKKMLVEIRKRPLSLNFLMKQILKLTSRAYWL
jgi:hypothetical protein